jgi:hypothetical protein
MAETRFLPQSVSASRPTQFPSLRESCLRLLRDAKTSSGRPYPLTAQEMVNQLQTVGLCISTGDVEGLLRELCQEGLIQEIDPMAGFRWVPCAA